MATIKIENGCFRNLNGMWSYPHASVNGFVTTAFTVADGVVPEIGDFITDGRLVKREVPQINNDGRLKWPSDNKDEYVQVGKLYEK